MNPNDPTPPTDAELAAASMTVALPQRDTSPLRDRLAAAASLLQSVDKPPTEASLIFSRGGSAPVEAVPIGSGITVGRGSDATVCLEKCADLSRRHFCVRPQSGVWLLEDLGSRNGTTIDGADERITRRLLKDGDIIFAGDLLFLFVNPAD
ncbi:MAG: FHA domain-containing protein [Chthoniobacteraceae bacterium]